MKKKLKVLLLFLAGSIIPAVFIIALAINPMIIIALILLALIFIVCSIGGIMAVSFYLKTEFDETISQIVQILFTKKGKK